MALVFPRIARNLARNGFYPTDSVTTSRILPALQASESDRYIRLFDPCCGEGVALNSVAKHLGSRSITFGVEFDADRALIAKTRLANVIWSDFQDTVIEPAGFDLLFLNPPYGHLTSDRALTGDEDINRFEELFYQKSVRNLAFGGVLVFIIPRYELKAKLARWIAKSFTSIKVFTAPEQTYQQIVLFGVRRHAAQSGYEATARWLEGIGRSESGISIEELPETWNAEPYLVPASGDVDAKFRFGSIELDPLQVAEIRSREPVLWNTFESIFSRAGRSLDRPPLRAVGEWHLALLMASGAVNGLVEGGRGERYLLKGSTTKAAKSAQDVEVNDDGAVTAVVTTVTERFVPNIRAIDINPSSPSFGVTFDIQ